jgi:Flp pilus assembly protein TadD
MTAKAQAALEKGSAIRAIELARKATQNDPSNAEAWLTLGAAYDAAGSHGQARTAYKNCAEHASGPSVAECKALIGR